MNLHSIIPTRTTLAILCGLAFATCVKTTSARADGWDKRTLLTVNETIQVKDTVLDPGQYIIRLMDSPTDRHVVQIFNRDESHIINTFLAIPATRVYPTDHTVITFWETPPGSVRAVRKWFYPGDNMGQEFTYPKHLQLMAMVTNPVPAPVVTQSEASAVETTPAPAENTQSETTEAQTQEQTEQQPAEVAQNETTTQTPAHSTPEQPAQQLPTTGSPYPFIGMCGVLLLGLAALLKMRRTA
jgi:hypothetical protein